MDKSQIIKWFISLCLSISPFWSFSQSTGEAESFERNFEALDEDVQNELFFKRLMIEAIDTSLEVHEALGFDSSNTWQRVAVALPAYVAIRGTYAAQKGLMSDVRHLTPEKRQTYKKAYKGQRKALSNYFNKRKELYNAQDKLSAMIGDRNKILEEQRTKAVQANVDTTAQTNNIKPIEADTTPADKPVGQAERGKSSITAGNSSAQSPSGSSAQPAPSVTAEMIEEQKRLVQQLESQETNITDKYNSNERKPNALQEEEILDTRNDLEKAKSRLSELEHKFAEQNQTAQTQTAERGQTAQTAEGQTEKPAGQTEQPADKRRTTFGDKARREREARIAQANTEQGKPSASVADKTAPAEANKPAGQTADVDTTAPAQTEKPAGQTTADKGTTAPAEANKPTGQTTADKGTTVPAEANKPAGQTTADKGTTVPAEANKPAGQTTADKGTAGTQKPAKSPIDIAIDDQRKLVETLRTEMSQLENTISRSIRTNITNIFHRVGRLLRGAGFLAIGLAGIPVYVAAVGETILIVFDLPEDMQNLKEQYVQDIEEVIMSSADPAT